MDTDFWHQKWKSNDIGFHQDEYNPQLIKYFNKLKLATGSRVFVPLCGKTLDIAWLLENNYAVAGVELNEPAVEALFATLGVKPVVSDKENHRHYQANNLDIFVGDFFQLTTIDLGSEIGDVDAVYDRAALVALPTDMRRRYAAHLISLTKAAPQLLLSFEYDQQAMAGPPFSVTESEIIQLYGEVFALNRLACFPVEGGLKGICPADESVWLLQTR